ncbi:zinc-binding dehydrogenase [Nonomuraea sp. NPDC050404]|uniref:zinc-binding dehydrogenase n=1 Tax=Nonomuraea sp. NPDC050404 TaxID=3155783 RepID=UPI0033F5DF13
MKIVEVTKFGGPEVLVAGQAPDPVAGPGQVVIGVSVVDVLSVEAQLRTGWGRDWFPAEPPFVPGTGVAGRVLSVGDGVDAGWVGRRVAAKLSIGAYAEQAVADAETVVAVPDELPLWRAAALLQVGPAALSLVTAAELRPGARVLVTGAGGALGLVLVQLASAAGARVTAAAHGPAKRRAALEAGAAEIIDYPEPEKAEAAETAGTTGPAEPVGTAGTAGTGASEKAGAAEAAVSGKAGAAKAVGPGKAEAAAAAEADSYEKAEEAGVGEFDVVFDGVGGDVGAAVFGLVGRGGRFFAYGVPSGAPASIDPALAERREVRVIGMEQVMFAPDEFSRLAEQAFKEAVAGRLTTAVGLVLPLERASEAHAALEARELVGKALLLATAQAVRYDRCGGPEVLELMEIPLPEPGPGQVRVAVRAAGVNPIDWKMREGFRGAPPDASQGTGMELAGMVDALGPGVTGLRLGDPVYGQVAPGAVATHAIAEADALAPKPDGLTYEQAAALPVAVETARRALRDLALKEGETLLIHGVAGGVGLAAAQLALARGASVIGTASERHHDFLRDLGVHPVTYGEGLEGRLPGPASDESGGRGEGKGRGRGAGEGGRDGKQVPGASGGGESPRSVDRVLDASGQGESPRSIDRVLDASGRGELELSVKLTGDPNRVITIADRIGAERLGVRFSTGDGAAAAAQALRESQHVRLPIAEVFPLEHTADAHRRSQHGHFLGKLIINPETSLPH